MAKTVSAFSFFQFRRAGFTRRVLLLAILPLQGLGALELDGLNDPTRPYGWEAPRPSAVAIQRPRVRLDSVFIAGDKRFAVISGKSVPEGATVNGVRVKAVRPDSVDFQWRGESWTVQSGKQAKPVISIGR